MWCKRTATGRVALGRRFRRGNQTRHSSTACGQRFAKLTQRIWTRSCGNNAAPEPTCANWGKRSWHRATRLPWLCERSHALQRLLSAPSVQGPQRRVCALGEDTLAAWLGEDTLVSSVAVQPPPPPPQEGHAPFDYLPFEVAWMVEGGTMFLVLNYHHRIQTLAGGG